MAVKNRSKTLTAIAPVSDGARPDVELEAPYVVEFTLEGTAALLFHAWNNEAVAEKGSAKKGSAAKKTDNVESYVYRNDGNEICIPGAYVHGSLRDAARYRQDPRSPRKSAMDLYKAAVSPLTEFASLGKTDWDYEDRRRVTIQRSAVTRARPAFLPGWQATFEFLVGLPEYVQPADLLDVLTLAGRVIGLADFRPTYGRFAVTSYGVVDLA